MRSDPAALGGVGPAVSWPEPMAAMSLACDTALALPLETVLATCLVAMQLAQQGSPGTCCPGTYALAMLEHIGCTASSAENAAVTGIIEGVFTARHTGPMPTPDGEIPPTGNTVSFPFACFFQVRDGRRVSHHIYFDNLAMMAQLGAPG